MSDLNITQNKHNDDTMLFGQARVRDAGRGGASPRVSATPDLTRTNNSTTTPVNFDPEIALRSRSLLDSLMVQSLLVPSDYRFLFKRGFVRYRKSGDFFDCYEVPNPNGNSGCSFGLNKNDDGLIESNSENARFTSYNRLIRIIHANAQMTYFFTGTLNPRLWARNDFKAFYKPFSRFLHHKGIKYILVPEFHADGENIHIHGLFDSSIEPYLMPFDVDSPLPRYILDAIDSGVEVFDFPDYRKRFGYVSVSRVRDAEKVAHYVSEYILKSIRDSECRVAHRRYYCSRGLNRPYFEMPTYDDLCALNPDYFSGKIVKVYGKVGNDDNTHERRCDVATYSSEGV